MLLWDSAADVAIASLELDHFYAPSHKLLFNFVRDMRKRGERVEWRLLADRLKLVNRLEDIGGEDYIIHLAEFIISPALCQEHCRTVKEYWKRRERVAIGEAAADRDVPQDELNLRLERLQQQTVQGASARSGRLGEFVGRKRKQGVATGFGFIDTQTTCQGLPEGQMSVVLADTGSGKTAWSLQVARNAAEMGVPVCYATFADMDGFDLADRLIKNYCGRVSAPSENHQDFERYHESVKAIQKLPIDVYDATEMDSGRDVETFAAWFQAKLDRQKGDERWKLCVIDYAQELTSRNTKAKNQYDEAQACAHAVRWLAARTGVAFLIGSQMTAGNEKAGTKDITLGSRVWMQRAALILRLQVLDDAERAKVKDPQYSCLPHLTDARLMKNRFGQKGGQEWWQWVPEFARFEERS
jgi:replicative DNA helicase